MSSRDRVGRLAELGLHHRMGGRLTPGSGALAGAKADLDLDLFKVENKCTTKQSIALQSGWVMKVAHEARAVGKWPAVAIQFVNGVGKPVCEPQMLIPERVFKELMEAYEQCQSE